MKIQIILRFGSKEGTKTGKFDLDSNEQFRVLRRVANMKITEMKNIDMVFISIQPDGTRLIAEDTSILGNMAIDNKIELLCLPKKCDVVIKSAENTRTLSIDVETTVITILMQLFPDNPHIYALGFTNSESNIIMCSQILPLCAQGWFHETLYLFRRVLPQDSTLPQDDQAQTQLIRNARWASSMGLSLYPLDEWSTLTALLLFIENKQIPSQNFVRENYMRFVPPVFKGNDAFVKKVVIQLQQLSSLTMEKATNEYLSKASASGCQCAFVQTIKFKVGERNWGWKDAHIYASFVQIGVTRDRGLTIYSDKPTNEISKVVREKETVVIIFKDQTKWFCKSPNPPVLQSAIEEMMHPPALTPQFESSHSVTEDEVVDLPTMETTQDDDIALPSSFSFNEDAEIFKKPVSFATRPLLEYGRGVSPIKIPPLSEADEPIPARDMGIHIVKPLDFNAPIETPPLPSAEEFFGISLNQPQGNIMLLLSLVGIAILILKLLRHS